eukprot:1261880-Prymnesium_polylepis.1
MSRARRDSAERVCSRLPTQGSSHRMRTTHTATQPMRLEPLASSICVCLLPPGRDAVSSDDDGV